VRKGVAVGFVGIGAMGEPMARCLLRGGYRVFACAHRNRERLERILAEGAVEAGTPAEVATHSSAVITCVPDAPQVEEAIFGPHGLLAGAATPLSFIDMSTISPLATRGIARRLIERGHRFIDAPVSGGPVRAAQGNLTIMVGAQAKDFKALVPILKTMGTPTHVGPVGMGETVKLTNQILIANIMLANAEALSFARKSGADSETVRAVLATATGANYLLEEWLPKTWFANDFAGGFALDLLRKDLSAALEAARAMNLPMPASAFAYQLYTAQSAKGDGADDYSAVAKLYDQFV